MTARRRLLSGASVQIGSLVSVNFGNAVAGALMPVVGVFPVAAARQIVMAASLAPFWRPTRAKLAWRRMWPAVVLGLVMLAMNLSYYIAVDRLGLGIAAVLEYLGPFALALLGSRRIVDGLCGLAAAGGVLLLTEASGRIDGLGLAFALLAAVFWAGYILFTRRVALALPGFEGITVASLVSCIAAIPLAIATIDWAGVTGREWLLLLVLGVLASAIPYSLDSFVLRRVTPRIYDVLSAFGPAVAAVFGWLVLHETFNLPMVIGIGLVVAGSATAILSHREPDSQPAALPPEAGAA